MTTARSGEVLKGLLGDPEIAEPPADAASGDHALPSLSERVEIYLAAVHGPSQSFSAEQRAAARARILEAIAADLEEQAAESLPEYQDRGVSARLSLPRTRFWSRLIRALGRSTSDVALPDAIRLFGLAPQWRPAVAFVGIVMALGVAWTGVWLQTLRRMQSTLAAWGDLADTSGYACGSRTIGGYPLRAELRCRDARVTLVAESGPAVIRVREFRAVAEPFAGRVAIEFGGPVSLTAADGSPRLAGTVAQGAITILGPPSLLPSVDVSLEGFRLDWKGQGAVTTTVSGDTVALVTRPDATLPSADGKLDVTVHLRQGEAVITGSPIEPIDVDVTAALSGLGTIQQGTLLAAVKQWQAAGGQLLVEAAEVRQAAAVAHANGSISLDGSGRVAGGLEVSATEVSLTRLAAGFLGDAGAAKAKVAQLYPPRTILRAPVNPDAMRPGESHLPDRERIVSLTVKGGSVSLGDTVPLGEIPPLY